MVCKICRHSQLDEIDEGLLDRRPFRDIAKQFRISSASVHRHQKHLDTTLRKAREAANLDRADSLLEQLRLLKKDAQRIKSKAEAAKDFRGALAGIRELERLLELTLRLSGTLVQGAGSNVQVSMISSSDPELSRRVTRLALKLLKWQVGLADPNTILVITTEQADELAHKIREAYGLRMTGKEALKIANDGLLLSSPSLAQCDGIEGRTKGTSPVPVR